MPPSPPGGYADTRRATWIGAGIAAAALGVALVGLNAAGILRFTAKGPDPSLRATGEKAPVALRSPEVMMPDDIRAWLEHLERIEKERVRLTKEQFKVVGLESLTMPSISQADAFMSLLDDDDSSNNRATESLESSASMIDTIRPAWANLAMEFEELAPPEECRTIAAKYGKVLRETGATMGDVLESINAVRSLDLSNTSTTDQMKEQIERLKGVASTNANQIDKPAIEVDHGVQDICDKYNTRKWFDIVGNVGGGGSLLSPNMPGLGGVGGLGG